MKRDRIKHRDQLLIRKATFRDRISDNILDAVLSETPDAVRLYHCMTCASCVYAAEILTQTKAR